MRADEIEKELKDLLGLILSEPVTASTSRANQPGWDSLKHMQIVFAIEERFEVRFSEEEIPQLDSFDKLAKHLQKLHAA
jgi:acyl carrier protein